MFHQESGHAWYRTGHGRLPSSSPRRRMASAMIAKIPLALSRHIAAVYKYERAWDRGEAMSDPEDDAALQHAADSAHAAWVEDEWPKGAVAMTKNLDLLTGRAARAGGGVEKAGGRSGLRSGDGRRRGVGCLFGGDRAAG